MLNGVGEWRNSLGRWEGVGEPFSAASVVHHLLINGRKLTEQIFLKGSYWRCLSVHPGGGWRFLYYFHGFSLYICCLDSFPDVYTVEHSTRRNQVCLKCTWFLDGGLFHHDLAYVVHTTKFRLMPRKMSHAYCSTQHCCVCVAVQVFLYLAVVLQLCTLLPAL